MVEKATRIALSDHTYDGDEVIGTFTDNGEIIVAPAAGLPVSTPVSLSQIQTHLGHPVSLKDGRVMDMSKQTGAVSLANCAGKVWGQSLDFVDQGSGMDTTKWDWRRDGQSPAKTLRIEGERGNPMAYGSVGNKTSLSAPGAITGNGYFYADAVEHEFSFEWDVYQKSNSQHNADMFVALWGYSSGYLSGSRLDAVAYQKFNTMNAPTGSKSYTFYVNPSYRHMVVNFTWWVPEYNGVLENITCRIKNARVTRKK